jgi:hypothetical protein
MFKIVTGVTDFQTIYANTLMLKSSSSSIWLDGTLSTASTLQLSRRAVAPSEGGSTSHFPWLSARFTIIVGFSVLRLFDEGVIDHCVPGVVNADE